MKKKVIILISILAIIGIFIGIKVQQSSSRSDLEKALGVDFKKVDKVTIRDGSTGKKSEIVGKEKIEEFFKNFEGTKLTKTSGGEKNKGFIFLAGLSGSDKELVSFDFGANRIRVFKGNDDTKVYTSSINIDDNKIENIRLKYGLTR